jgi:DNA-binding NtrC family response regulator
MEKKNIRILVVDDEKSITSLLKRILNKAGYAIETAFSGGDGLQKVGKFSPNIVITDLKMPDKTGIELMREVKSKRPEIDFILFTAYATVENAVQALKEGAADYLMKPLKGPDELLMAVEKAVERQQLVNATSLWRSQLAEGLPPVDVMFVGMEEVWNEINQVAGTESTILLLGESGTGKSLIAKAIHHLSERSGPFVELNCAAIPETLIESELFGHEKGAFTGAVKMKRGKFELAQDGTIFLDEIGEMPLAAQAKLLRIIQDKSFERVGGVSTLSTSARIVAATNQDLKARIQERHFREDLYYRLNVFPIHLPALRNRQGAIPILVKYLIRDIAAKVGRDVEDLDEASINELQSYDWPGNIRELHNVLERAVILQQKPVMAQRETTPMDEAPLPEKNLNLKHVEKETIKLALDKTKGNRTKASKILGISLRTLHNKLKEYELGQADS